MHRPSERCAPPRPPPQMLPAFLIRTRFANGAVMYNPFGDGGAMHHCMPHLHKGPPMRYDADCETDYWCATSFISPRRSRSQQAALLLTAALLLGRDDDGSAEWAAMMQRVEVEKTVLERAGPRL